MTDGSGTTVANTGSLGSAYNGLLTAACYGGSANALPQYSYTTSVSDSSSTYALPTWSSAGPFGACLTFSGYQPEAWNAYGPAETDWGMNCVSVPSGAANTLGCGLGDTSNATISMWVNWGTNAQYSMVHFGNGTSTPNTGVIANSYGQPIGWNGIASFSTLECGLIGSGGSTTAGSVPLGLTTTNAQSSVGSTTLSGTPGTGWNNIVITAASGTWSEYLNGTLLSSVSGTALGVGSTASQNGTGSPSSQQQPLTLGGCFAYGWNNTATCPWGPYAKGSLTTGNPVGYIGPFNGSMSDVGIYNAALAPARWPPSTTRRRFPG